MWAYAWRKLRFDFDFRINRNSCITILYFENLYLVWQINWLIILRCPVNVYLY